MVCLGNICRSPLAEGILKSKTKNLEVDSAGTAGYHIGKQPDIRSIDIAKKHDIDLTSQRARQFSTSDFDDFDKIYVMDNDNYSETSGTFSEKDEYQDEEKEDPFTSSTDTKISKKSKTPVLDNFGRDITDLAINDKLDPVVGREKEIERVSQILSRRKKNNPLLIGEPGVGKSAIAEGLAKLITDFIILDFEAMLPHLK